MSHTTLPSRLQQLLDSFHTQLDDSLIVAIASDYDLSTQTGYDEACSTLHSLASNAGIEAASSYDPSGVYRFTEHDDLNPNHDPASTSRPNQGNGSMKSLIWNCEEIDTPQSFGPAKIVMSDAELSKSELLERDVFQLQSLFPGIDSLDIRHVLTSANGVVAAALDSLLSLQYLQSTGHPTAFLNGPLGADDSRVQSIGKSGDEGSDKLYENSGSKSSRLKTPTAIAYIAERLNISAEEVSIMYAESGNSRSATVIGILDQHLLQENGEIFTSSEKKAAGDLKQKYRNVPESYLQVIIRIAGPTSTYSSELASLVNTYFSKRSMNRKVELDYRLTPLPHDDIEGSMETAVDTLAEGRRISNKSTLVGKTDADLARALQTSTALQKQKHDAMASAASLHRRGASNPLYRQAAGYYAQQAREHAVRAQDATSTAADIHVDQQSTKTTVDLHGVSVLDGVRIARQRAVDWWQTGRESRHQWREEQKSEQNLTIITGLGRHNSGGVSPLRKAVATALTRDGWKFKTETGRFVITGR